MDLFRNRRDILREELGQLGFDGLVSNSMPDIRYLTGCLDVGGFLVLGVDGDTHLLTSMHDEPQASGEIRDVEIAAWAPGDDPLERLVDRLRVLGTRRLAIASLGISDFVRLRAQCTALEAEIVPDLAAGLRRVKDASELPVMRHAAHIAEAGMETARAILRPGVRERDVSIEAGSAMRRLGCDGFAFEMKIESGKRSSWPSTYAGDRVIEAGDLVLVDFGPSYRGYYGDLTRTFIAGEPSLQQRDLLEAVLSAQSAALSIMQPGVTGHAVDAAARAVLDRADLGQCLHHTGHTLGLVGDAVPILAPNQHTVLLRGESVTVEPGLYVPGLGGARIEDDVLVTDDGVELLTQFPRSIDALIVE